MGMAHMSLGPWGMELGGQVPGSLGHFFIPHGSPRATEGEHDHEHDKQHDINSYSSKSSDSRAHRPTECESEKYTALA